MPGWKMYAGLLAMIVMGQPAHAENWTEFRGPSGQGHYDGKPLPIEWSTTKNVVWKTPIPGLGWSSPVLYKDRVYLTTAVPLDKKTKEHSLRAFCLDAQSGKILWDTEVFSQKGKKVLRVHSKNSHASPSPITDGEHLFVHFGHDGTACLDLEGKIVWRQQSLRYQPVHGNGGTPIFADDKLVFSIDGSDMQCLVALSKKDGSIAWKTDRASKANRKFSFSTPLLVDADGKKQIVSPASDAVIAYDPANGKELWRVAYDGYSVIPRPVLGHGMVFISTGYNTPKLLAIRLGGTGNITESHIAWERGKAAPHTPSPLLVGDELYTVSDRGIASCIDARTGEEHWQERVGGQFSASPTYADGKIYLQSEKGVTTVLRPGKKFEKLAENDLEERTFASYAIADGAIYLRTETQLYRIEKK